MQEASIETNDLPGHCTAIQTKAQLKGSWGGQRAGLLSSTLLLDKVVKTVWEIPPVRKKQTVEHHSNASLSSCLLFQPFLHTLSKTGPLQTSSSLAPVIHPHFRFHQAVCSFPSMTWALSRNSIKKTEVKLTLPCLSDLLLTVMCNYRHSPAWCSYCIQVRRTMKNLATRAPTPQKIKTKLMLRKLVMFCWFFFSWKFRKIQTKIDSRLN